MYVTQPLRWFTVCVRIFDGGFSFTCETCMFNANRTLSHRTSASYKFTAPEKMLLIVMYTHKNMRCIPYCAAHMAYHDVDVLVKAPFASFGVFHYCKTCIHTSPWGSRGIPRRGRLSKHLLPVLAYFIIARLTYTWWGLACLLQWS